MELLKVLNILMVSIIPLTQWRFDRNWMYLGKCQDHCYNQTKDFGNIYFIAVGAMMVGSIVLTKDTGYEISKGEELGYFKFEGLLFYY